MPSLPALLEHSVLWLGWPWLAPSRAGWRPFLHTGLGGSLRGRLTFCDSGKDDRVAVTVGLEQA